MVTLLRRSMTLGEKAGKMECWEAGRLEGWEAGKLGGGEVKIAVWPMVLAAGYKNPK